MTSSEPIHETCLIRRSSFAKSVVWASIDKGSSLIKVCLVDKEERLRKNAKDDDLVTVHLYLFKYGQENEIIKLIKERAHIPKEIERIHGTGAGFAFMIPMITEILGVTAHFIDEFKSQCVAFCELLKSNEESDIFYQWSSKPRKYKFVTGPFMSKDHKEMIHSMTKNDHDDGEILPALFIVAGSATVPLLVDKDGSGSPVGCQMVGACPFMGLAKLLLGTNDYDEIMSLAEKGNIENTHFLIKDNLPEDTDYGDISPDLPYFAFGRYMRDHDENTPIRKEDVAACLVAMFAENLYNEAIHASVITGFSKVYVCGNWIRAEVARRSICETLSVRYPNILNFKFVKGGHLNALGCMLMEKNEH